MLNQISIHPVSPKNRDAIINLLQSEKLPTEDLPSELINYFIASDHGLVVGVIGLEVFESNGLLRSLAVKQEYRNKNIAAALISKLEERSKNLHLKNLYLLTETAEDYFSKKSFVRIDRSEAPVSIQQSSEFSHVCPSTAALMIKKL